MLPATLYFASARPRALELPHLITALDAELVGKIAHLTKARLGLWCVPAPFNEQDVCDRARESAPLAAWKSPANQAELLSYSPYIQEAIFGTKLMILDADFDEPTLARMAVVVGKRLETGAYVTRGFEDLPELPELVHRCHWAVIPIGRERCKALFIVSQSKADWIAKMQEWCEREGRNFAQLRLEGESAAVVEHPAPERYRDNAINHRIDAFLGDMEVYFGGADESVLAAVEKRIQARRELRQAVAQTNQETPAGAQ